MANQKEQLGSDLFCQSLADEGVEVMFGIPGGVVLPLYDKINQYGHRIRHILPRQEQGGGFAADGELDTYVDGRVAFLEAELGITQDQQGVWKDYADALRSNADVMVAMHGRMRDAVGGQDTAPTAWLDLHIEMMKSRLAALEALKPATEALYVALTPEQKQKANRLLPAMGCM